VQHSDPREFLWRATEGSLLGRIGSNDPLYELLRPNQLGEVGAWGGPTLRYLTR